MLQAEKLKRVKLPNGETISYREKPGGHKLCVLIHGNMTSSKHWDVLMDAFNEEYTIIAPDLRGFGRSSYNERINHIKDFSDDLKMFVDVLQLNDFSIVGWSTGGAVGMQFCANYPGYCEKLVLLASASTRGYPFFKTNDDGSSNGTTRLTTIEEIESDFGKTIPMQHLYSTKNREGLKAVWNAVIYTHNKPSDEKYEEYIDDMLTQRNLPDVYHALNTFNMSRYDHSAAKGTGEVDLIQIPVLILYGERDLVVPFEMTSELMEDFGDKAQAICLKNCGHSPFIDDVTLLKQSIENFLR